jgi:hypothetical protein
MYGGRSGVYRVLVRKPEGKRPHGRPRRRWGIILRRIFGKWEGEGMGWIDLAQVRDRWQALVNVVMKLRVPQNAGNFLTS